MIVALAATIALSVAPGGEVNPECPRASHGYDFAVVVHGKRQRHARYERGALVFPHVAVVQTFKRSISLHNDGRGWLRLEWSCEP